MKRTFLIARQEFIKYVTRRGFAISILMFPLWIVIVTLVPQWTGGGGDSPRVFTVVDRSGGFYRGEILGAVARDNEQRDLDGLAHYAGSYADARKLSPEIAAMLESPDTVTSREQFHLLGLTKVLAALAPATKPGAPAFAPGPPRFIYQPPPGYLIAAKDRELPGALQRLFGGDAGPRIQAVVVVEAGFGPANTIGAQFWSSEARPTLHDFISDALDAALRHAAIRKYAPQIDDPALLEPGVDLLSLSPYRTDGRNSTVDSIVPVALAIILFVVSVMNSSVLLQGVVEEKSTRMIEVLLSCATPREITSGKLIGVIAVALTTLIIWALALFALMAVASHDTVTLVFASLSATASLDTLPLLLIFFLCGLLIYGSLFLAIGSMANSLADAQSLLGPSMLILMLPNLMIAGVMKDPNGTLASTLSWVPIYTPFFMMLRLSSHPPVWQLWGTALLALTTTALLIFWTGRVFAKHVLTTERPPALGKLVAGLFKRRA